jgi:hypothetical protein
MELYTCPGRFNSNVSTKHLYLEHSLLSLPVVNTLCWRFFEPLGASALFVIPNSPHPIMAVVSGTMAPEFHRGLHFSIPAN